MTTVKHLTVATQITLCIILSFSLELTTGVQIFNPPRFVPERPKPLEIDTGSSISLVCESEYPVIWHYPGSERYIPEDDLGKKDIESYFTDDGYFVPDADDNSNENVDLGDSDDGADEGDDDDDDEENTIVNITQSYVSGKYRSVFHMPVAKYLNTGYYYCILNHTKSLSVEHNLTRQYIFVKDEQHMIAIKDAYPIIHAIQYRKAVIPCRPSSPSFNITLRRSNEVINSGSYDPRVGFTVTFLKLSDGGTYICEANQGSKQVLNIHVVVDSKSEQAKEMGGGGDGDINICAANSGMAFVCSLLASSMIALT